MSEQQGLCDRLVGLWVADMSASGVAVSEQSTQPCLRSARVDASFVCENASTHLMAHAMLPAPRRRGQAHDGLRDGLPRMTGDACADR